MVGISSNRSHTRVALWAYRAPPRGPGCSLSALPSRLSLTLCHPSHPPLCHLCLVSYRSLGVACRGHGTHVPASMSFPLCWLATQDGNMDGTHRVPPHEKVLSPSLSPLLYVGLVFCPSTKPMGNSSPQAAKTAAYEKLEKRATLQRSSEGLVCTPGP